MAAEKGLGEEKPHLLAFPAVLVAEQFTLMDAVGSASQQGGSGCPFLPASPAQTCHSLSGAGVLPQIPLPPLETTCPRRVSQPRGLDSLQPVAAGPCPSAQLPCIIETWVGFSALSGGGELTEVQPAPWDALHPHVC